MRIKIFISGLLSCLLFVSCDKVEEATEPKTGACEHGFNDANIAYSPAYAFKRWTGAATIPDGAATLYIYVGSRVAFFIGNKIENICTNEHLNLDYKVKMKNVAQPLRLTIYGEVTWGGSYNKVPIYESFPAPGANYSKNWQLGLLQAFPTGPADVTPFLTVEFDATGSGPALNSADSSFFVEHVETMNITSHYSKH